MQLQQHARAFEDLDIHIVVVTFEAESMARGYADEMAVPWPLLIDETREVYRAYGMLAGDVWNVWGPSAWWAYLKEFARGRLPRKPHADVMQLGGDVLIDPAGIVRFHHIGKGPADRPSVRTLVRARQTSR